MSQLPTGSNDLGKPLIQDAIAEKPPAYSEATNSVYGQPTQLGPQPQANTVFVPVQVVPAVPGNTTGTVNVVTTIQQTPACTVLPAVSCCLFIQVFI